MGESLWNSGSELFANGADERLDHVLVAFEKVPLAGFLAGNQAGPLQGRQVCGDGRLRQAAALVDLPGANAVLVVVGLVGELDLGVLEPVENVSPYWVCQGFYYFVEVNVHGGARVGKTLYRDEANFKSVFRDIPI